MQTRKIFLLIQVAILKFAYANELAPQEEITLCNEGEDVYFSCPLDNGKVISVCAKNNLNPKQGYVKYKYGAGRDIFVYPKNGIPPNKILKLSDVSEGSIRGLHLKFENGPYTYVVSSVWPGQLYVLKNKKIVFDKQCQASKYKSFSNKIFDGVNQAPPSEVDVH
ncbi:hypothetical protein F6X40_00630 [Paraburkholderia sp. UCT31]|uniref:hypothetical protein n=1 Tax=Paraburkholderia sp. UCT31 TaxID=2615209 RepID=UPI0016550B6B|nr:hypothetical protein [Paraburkholderia sp. UCT31]MBC8735377.1 hypothetical protein [Paraburkholderia sp. UCT31]